MGNRNGDHTLADHEDSVHEVVLGMLEGDEVVSSLVKEWVLEALALVESSGPDAHVQTGPTYLSSISVVGFRGIGSQARLDLYPAPGLMVVSGRNGSGKSSFSEALELALTGTSYRWHNKAALWEEAWRNLHHPEPCAIRVGFTAEGTGPFTVGTEWKAGAELADRSLWTQTGSAERVPGTDHLGWSRPLELRRPVLSYEELGKLFDGGPSALYDALSKLLGLEVLSDAEKWLSTSIKDTKVTRARADDQRRGLITSLAALDDDRARRAIALLRMRGGAPIDEVTAIATGADDDGQRAVGLLRSLSTLEAPTVDDVETAASRLRSAKQAVDATAHALAEGAAQRVDVLEAALRFHGETGDSECPVCGQGRLDDEWAARISHVITTTEETLSEYRAASRELKESRAASLALIARAQAVSPIDEVPLTAIDDYKLAIDAASAVPDGDFELCDHLETALTGVIAAAEEVRSAASQLLAVRADEWSPLAARLAAWVTVEQDARLLDDTLDAMNGAKKWVTESTKPFRDQRLESIAAQARNIWRSCAKRATSTSERSRFRAVQHVDGPFSAGRSTVSPRRRFR